ncbi:hypothetical protein OHC33_004085 [Knufia fluminis]|uniref:Uncharacterized protein n=1 Tax=Knufia fluminis TaxID=191047 RepID=A0AAN8EFG3_9EURO|nr:hypothetical protein OHC33_004085 [Knufia fluminis]
MIYTSTEGPIQVPVTDIVSFCFDKQNDFNEEKPVLIDADEPSRCLNYKQYRTLVRRLIAGFRAYGLQDGDSVLCQVGNTYLYPVLFMSIVGAGGVWVGSNPANQHHEVDHYVQLGNPKFIVTEAAGLSKILPICEERQIPRENVFVFDIDTFPLYIGVPSVFWGCSDAVKTSDSTRSFTDLLCHGELDWKTINTPEEAKSSPAVYFSTSGTTGQPKLAMVSHWNMIAHHLMIHQEVPFEVTRVISLPFFHLFATSFTFIQPTRYGHTTYVMRRFHLEKYLRYHSQYQATEAYMAPPMLIAMIQSEFDVKDLLKTVRFAATGGAPCDAVSINKFRSLLTDATMTALWGMTETGVASGFRYGENDETGSVGRFFRGMEGKLIDADGNLVTEDGEPGELYCRTQGVMLGYRNMEFPEEEKEWFRTGDVCCLREGKLYIVGRAKELIKVKGWQVAPAELEAVLLQHPEIVDAAVCGTVAANGVDEVPRAYVVRQKKLHETSMITAEEVYQFSRTRLASYKALDGGVCFVEEIPRTPSGKIQRAKLSRMDEYRRSVTVILLSTGITTEQKGKISEIKDTAMHGVEVASPTQNIEASPRRSVRISAHRSNTSTSSSSSEGLSLGSLRMRPRRKLTGSSTMSDNGVSVTTTNIQKVQKKQSKRSKIKKLVKAVQAAAA